MKKQIRWQTIELTAPGDSGSALVSAEDEPRIVGLHWGASSDGFAYVN